jgi:hypothetical protein
MLFAVRNVLVPHSSIETGRIDTGNEEEPILSDLSDLQRFPLPYPTPETAYASSENRATTTTTTTTATDKGLENANDIG